MFSQRRDFLVEMIERLVQGVLDRVREALGGETTKINELEHECERVMEDEFAELHRRVRALTSRSAGSVVRPVPKLRDYAMLLGALALAWAARAGADDRETARQDAQRALELLLEAILASEARPIDRSLAPELFKVAGADRLSRRYLEVLVTLGEST